MTIAKEDIEFNKGLIDNKFTGKGDRDRGLTNETYNDDVNSYREAIAAAEKELEQNKETLASSISEKTSQDVKEAENAEFAELENVIENHSKAGEALEGSLVKDLKDAVNTLKSITGPFGYRIPTAPTAPGGTTGGGTGGTGGGAGTPTAPEAAPTVILPPAAVPLAGPGAADGAMLADADEEEEAGLTTLEDEVTPLAGPEGKTETVNLEDFPTPLAGPVAEMGQMSWWWLLIIAVLGVTGEEMYRRYQKKQREQANIES